MIEKTINAEEALGQSEKEGNIAAKGVFEEQAQNLKTYEKILGNIGDDVLVIGRDFKIIWASKKSLKEYGADIVKRHCYEVTHKADHVCRPPDDICPIEEAIKTGQSAVHTHTHSHDGKTAYYDVSAYPIYGKSEIEAFVHIARDVTDNILAKENLMKAQQQALMEMSAPEVKVWDGILMMPLIGTIDSWRAQQIMETLLTAIEETQAKVAILDVSGIPVVDSLVARHLMRTVTAAKLMGSECIVTGIKSKISQTMVQLGVDFAGIITKSTLADGLKMALEATGQRTNSKKE